MLAVSPSGQVRFIDPHGSVPVGGHGLFPLLGQWVSSLRDCRLVCRREGAGLSQRYRRITPQPDATSAAIDGYALHPRLRTRIAYIQVEASSIIVYVTFLIALTMTADKAVMATLFLAHIIPTPLLKYCG